MCGVCRTCTVALVSLPSVFLKIGDTPDGVLLVSLFVPSKKGSDPYRVFFLV